MTQGNMGSKRLIMEEIGSGAKWTTKQFPFSEPFCSPITPHIPIRQRLANRRCTSVDVGDDPLVASYSTNSFYGPRRRRMSLLQTLRQQNRQLADSGLDMHRQRADSESTNRDTCSPLNKQSPPLSPTKKAFSSLKSSFKQLPWLPTSYAKDTTKKTDSIC
uniref:Uncharacterized protein n=1 Tax=Heterorhabditis bacteriophora TaxID=37862 RepID=A0A1I7XT51_HETBA